MNHNYFEPISLFVKLFQKSLLNLILINPGLAKDISSIFLSFFNKID